jgi:hypothetical protein
MESIPGPVVGTRMTKAYVQEIGRIAYFWAWPMLNIHNRMLAYEKLPAPGLAGGVLPVAPPNHLSMLHDYIEPSERAVACPNQDVVYGQSVVALNREPVVVQVPDFSGRFWVYQVVDQRTDSFAEIGQMYGSEPGYYLLVEPDWKGEKPEGINRIFACPTHLGMIIPRVFMDDSAEDRAAVQPYINQIAAYPLSEFDGMMKITDWTQVPIFPGDTGSSEVKWVKPELAFSQLAAVLDEVPPLPGEEAIYEQIRALLVAAEADPNIKAMLDEAAAAAEEDLVAPVFQFHNYGLPLPANWTTISNSAAFGMDYFTRTAVAKSNILVNRQNETKYFYQEFDANGERLNGRNRYSVTFAKGGLPPVRGFWSLTLYNEHHFFYPNDLNRYSLGTKNKSLRQSDDGSLTFYVQTEAPADATQRHNWLPAPDGDFSLYVRCYWPETPILDGSWMPPAVKRVNG